MQKTNKLITQMKKRIRKFAGISAAELDAQNLENRDVVEIHSIFFGSNKNG